MRLCRRRPPSGASTPVARRPTTARSRTPVAERPGAAAPSGPSGLTANPGRTAPARRGRPAAGELGARRAVVELCQHLVARNLTSGTSGNVSVRHRDGCLITPSALPYDRMAPADIVRLDRAGTPTGAHRPSSEWRFHVGIYSARPDVAAVVHVHSPNATALACLRRDLPPFHYMVAVAGGPDVRCAPYHPFGTAELAAATVAALEGRHACLLANHGQISVGADLGSALELAAEVEQLCGQYLAACAVAPPVLLSAAEMADVLDRFADYRRTGT